MVIQVLGFPWDLLLWFLVLVIAAFVGTSLALHRFHGRPLIRVDVEEQREDDHGVDAGE